MNPILEQNVIGDFLLREEDAHYSRGLATVIEAAGVLKPGAVLGKRTKSTVTATATEGNTGNGVMGVVTLGARAEVGNYLLRCIAAATNAGTFAVFTPSGYRLADATVAAAYAGAHLNFTLADGAADFIVGDTFTIAVTGDGKYDYAKAGAVNGLADAVAVLLVPVDTTEDDVPNALVLERDALVSVQGLIFDETVDDDNKRAAMVAGLKKVGILTVQGA
jgi:hypothetical protein